MTLRTGHGAGAGVPRVEVLPADELPAGVPGPTGEERQGDRGPDGRFRPRNAISAKGGHVKASHVKLAHKLSLDGLPPSAFDRYQRAAVSFRKAQCSELARTVGGGVCGPGPSSMVATSALQLAWSRFFSDRAAQNFDPDLAQRAAKLGNDSRQNLLAAHELCAREAEARARSAKKGDPQAALAARLLGPRAPPTPPPGPPTSETTDVPAK